MHIIVYIEDELDRDHGQLMSNVQVIHTGKAIEVKKSMKTEQ